MSEPILCYVSLPWCYFTTRELSKQWGDDWNDAPYEHNAGSPYGPHQGDEPFEISKLAIDSSLVTPDDGVLNSSFSVESINRGEVAWLRDRWGNSGVKIMAGTLVSEFKRLVSQAGGTVYAPENVRCA